eukprot:UN02289
MDAASRFGFPGIIKYLHKHGASVNQYNSKGGTPAYVASQEGHATCLKALFEVKANVNRPTNDDNCVPAYVAAQKNFLDCLKVIADYNGDLITQRSGGYTSVYIAACYDNHKVVEFLHQQNADLNTPNDDGATPAFIAAQKEVLGR